MTSSRKPRSERPTLPVPRDGAVNDIAAHLADRDAFIISIPPALIGTVASQLSALPSCTWYSDNGSDIVMRLAVVSIPAAEAIDMLAPGMTAAVAIVPKTIPAAQLTAALDHSAEIPEDGSQDLVMLRDDEDGPIIWPRLLTDAIAVIDPAFAVQLAALDLRGLS